MAEEDQAETERVSRDRGKSLAEAWVKSPKSLDIPDTLLNSDDIITVVDATGLISPFYLNGGRKSRLKKAAYEGRAGSKAYIYKEKNCPELIFDTDKDQFLLVPKNSIVFVESDLDFRLPDFIALRFNLQIQHVHRGLLLGTGPLVDPGFWGKLCIPLHNLTDQDYEIPKEEGLIWLEFTKTTLTSDKTDRARVPLNAASRDEKGYWEIERFLDKAASQYRGYKVPIRSSLPTMFDEANEAARKSAEDAKSALDVADKLRNYNFLSMIAAAVGFVAICITAASFLFNLASRNEEIAETLRTKAETAQNSIEQHVNDVDRYSLQLGEARASLPALRGNVDQQQREIADLKRQVNLLRAQLNRLEERARQSPPAPFAR